MIMLIKRTSTSHLYCKERDRRGSAAETECTSRIIKRVVVQINGFGALLINKSSHYIIKPEEPNRESSKEIGIVKAGVTVHQCETRSERRRHEGKDEL